ncbi:MAG TPA: cytochrome P450 [Acidimicrobiales bacterium]|nr:cytochrome P450 [Acidimicrobiales bacterium]
MDASSTAEEPITAEWCAEHFDHLAPQLGRELHETLERMRADHPVAHSDRYGGFWVATSYEDVLRVAQDWSTFSSAHGITVPSAPVTIPAIPEMVDPPLHREFKRLINAWFTPAVVLQQEQATRDLVTRLIDDVIEAGACDFMADFARPLPGLVFFEMVLHAPADELAEINRCATLASVPTNPEARAARGTMLAWITDFVDGRRAEPPRGDVVDAILNAEIEGRPITEQEVIGVIQLLLFGGLDTTAGALGQMMIRFCREPEIPALLRERPELIPAAVEELLRLDGPFVFIGRTAMDDAEVGGQTIRKGDKILISWVSANRDEAEFACPATFDLGRTSNRHIAFGAGPHRCAGSNLARMNLRIAVGELVRRFEDLRLADGGEIAFHSGFSRAPLAVPITFAPGPRLGEAGTTPGAPAPA